MPAEPGIVFSGQFVAHGPWWFISTKRMPCQTDVEIVRRNNDTVYRRLDGCFQLFGRSFFYGIDGSGDGGNGFLRVITGDGPRQAVQLCRQGGILFIDG